MKKIKFGLIILLLSMSVHAGAIEDKNNMKVFDFGIKSYHNVIKQNKEMSAFLPKHLLDEKLKVAKDNLRDAYEKGSINDKDLMRKKLKKENIQISGIK